MEEILQDERFSHIATDSSFRHIPTNVRKIKIDNRFKGMFKDKKLSKKGHVDKRGRALDLSSSDNFKNYYNYDEDSSGSEDDETVSRENKINKSSKVSSKYNKDKSKKIIDSKKSQNFEKKNESDCETYSKVYENSNKRHTESNVDKELNSLNNEINKSETRNSKKLHKSPKIAFSNKNHSFNQKDKLNKSNDDSSKKGKGFVISNTEDPRFQMESRSSEESSSCEEEEAKTTKEDESDSSSSSEEDSSESDDSYNKKSDYFDHQWEEQQEEAPDTDEITKRLSVCNMDWDRIRAIDLYTVFNSFKPPDSSLISVKIYPSEYGLKRMDEEKLKGPPELVEKTLNSDEEEDLDDKKGGRYNREKLRQYQLNRLKYYYAVVDCDTPETANVLYDHLNGMEYESSSVRFDLRFIPDDMTFDQEPTSVAENPDLTDYKPNIFVTTALQQVKVGLTWDETDPQRREIFQKAFTEPDDIERDIKEYLASSSGDSEFDEEIENEEDRNVKLSTEERIKKYKALLESLNEQKKENTDEKYEMEITWEPGIKEKTETLVKEKIGEKTSLTPFEELKKKKKAKQKMKKKEKNAKNQEMELQNSESDISDSDSSIEMEVNDLKKNFNNNEELFSTNATKSVKFNEQKHKNIKNKHEKSQYIQDELYLISDANKSEETYSQKKKKKKKVKQENLEDVKVDIHDERFSAIYTSPLYNIDPSDPHFKSTPGNLAIIAEKQRRLKNKSFSSLENPHKKFKLK